MSQSQAEVLEAVIFISVEQSHKNNKIYRSECVSMTRLYIHCWLWTTATLAQLQSFTPPGHNELTYSVNVPQDIASNASGPIYFQLRSTSPVQWFAWGQGTQMRGANIFVVYTSESGNNITVSPRLGEGHFEPLYNPNARISVLNDSGVSNGIITANVRCDSCISWPGGSENVTSSSSPWIWAVKYGAPLNSSDVSADIAIHDDNGLAFVNMKKATGGSLENPFANATIVTSAEPSETFDVESFHRQRIAHAVLTIVAFVIMFPFFALGLHLFPTTWTVNTHGFLQLLTLAIAAVGTALGISMAHQFELLQNYHPIIGMVVVAGLILFQPAMGILQHRYFRRTGGKNSFAYVHRWFGRLMIILGVVNAGLGFHLTGVGSPEAPRGAVIAYGVVAGVIGLGYMLAIEVVEHRRRHTVAP